MTGLSRQQQAIYDTLLAARGGWVSSLVLNRIAFRYSARLWDMKNRGIEWEKKAGEHGEWFYRLATPPPPPGLQMRLDLSLETNLTHTSQEEHAHG